MIMNMTLKRILIYANAAAGVLLIPLTAMLITNEVDWGPLDFAVAFVLLFSAGYFSDLLCRRLSNPNHRMLVVLGMILLVLLIWAELAVGVFGSPLAGS